MKSHAHVGAHALTNTHLPTCRVIGLAPVLISTGIFVPHELIQASILGERAVCSMRNPIRPCLGLSGFSQMLFKRGEGGREEGGRREEKERGRAGGGSVGGDLVAATILDQHLQAANECDTLALAIALSQLFTALPAIFWREEWESGACIREGG